MASCPVCGRRYNDDEPPGRCAKCKAPLDAFGTVGVPVMGPRLRVAASPAPHAGSSPGAPRLPDDDGDDAFRGIGLPIWAAKPRPRPKSAMAIEPREHIQEWHH